MKEWDWKKRNWNEKWVKHDICVKWFNLTRKVHIIFCFTFKVCEKIYLSSSWFLVSGWFWFLERLFFLDINRFITVLKVFYMVKNILKNWFLGQKYISANFLVVIVARIWAKSDFVLFNFFQDKLGRVTCYRPQGKQKNK